MDADLKKRFLVFACPWHDPSGGLADVVESFDDRADAIQCAQSRTNAWTEVYVYDQDSRVRVDV